MRVWVPRHFSLDLRTSAGPIRIDDVTGNIRARAAELNPRAAICTANLDITVDEGPSMWRIRARAQGRASWLQKRTANISVVLTER